MALLYGAVGACIVGIPLAALLILQICSSTALKRQVIDYKQLEKQGLYLHVWTLKLQEQICYRKKYGFLRQSIRRMLHRLDRLQAKRQRQH